uniref:Uncharacterized protein n=1 Tax=Branchiostoma floridae TaxID=7739 RepID=C3Z2Z8_BRAFL|eukprot:XP_002597025.1 hypothetical protein BRAFLDRAFT_96174 [Branchiostoma floridae]
MAQRTQDNPGRNPRADRSNDPGTGGRDGQSDRGQRVHWWGGRQVDAQEIRDQLNVHPTYGSKNDSSGNIGGMMGLFIGASVLSLLEVWEYLWQRLKGLLRRSRRPPVDDDKAAAYDLEKGTAFNNTAFNK